MQKGLTPKRDDFMCIGPSGLGFESPSESKVTDTELSFIATTQTYQ